VTIGDATNGTTIYYTTNGTAPTTSSSVYSGPITVSATETIEAIAVATGYANSGIAMAAYTINTATVLPAPTFSPVAGTYSTSQTVTISDATSGTTIYYTTNGTTPTTSSNVYSGPITVSSTETIEATAVESGYANSPVVTSIYTLSPGFSMALSPNSLSLASGQSASTTVEIIPVSKSNETISLGCTGLASGLSCAFSPSSVTTDGSPAAATLTITANASVAVRRDMPLVPIGVAGLLICAFGFRRRRRLHLWIVVAGAALGLAALGGCGGIQAPTHLTPAASTITVTASDGTVQQAAPLTVTVN
jgi:hypothetical protein